MDTAAKVIFLDRGEMPAPAFTDFSRIFIAREANNAQRVVLISHEQAHIWLNHKTRKPADFGKDGFKKDLWVVALEMEIARNIYTQEDEDEIEKPMTIISNGYTKKSFPKMPESVFLAEDIYEWLKNNPEEVKKSKCAVFCACTDSNEDKQGDAPTPCDIKNVKINIEEIKESMRSEAKKTPLSPMKRKKPSLAGEVDYILRSRKQRRRTYARPSRRETDPFILPGCRKTKKVPMVEIFVDRSGSMSGDKTGASVKRLFDILVKYRASVKSDVFYFSGDSLYDHDVPANGRNPYPLVMAHLEKSRPKIAVILTDYDESDTSGLTPLSHKETTILCVPICSERTAIANLIGAKDVL